MKMDWSDNGLPRRRRDLMSLMTEPVEITRGVVINGARRHFTIEADIWDSFKEIASTKKQSIDAICEELVSGVAADMSLSTAIRVFVLNYYRVSGAAPEVVN